MVTKFSHSHKKAVFIKIISFSSKGHKVGHKI